MFDSPSSWDVIIAGASFAGLAAAVELAGSHRVLLIDRDQIGASQTSACAPPPAA
jgi:glycine/D-amino acid oxidase-like deaminating enzyme